MHNITLRGIGVIQPNHPSSSKYELYCFSLHLIIAQLHFEVLNPYGCWYWKKWNYSLEKGSMFHFPSISTVVRLAEVGGSILSSTLNFSKSNKRERPSLFLSRGIAKVECRKYNILTKVGFGKNWSKHIWCLPYSNLMKHSHIVSSSDNHKYVTNLVLVCHKYFLDYQRGDASAKTGKTFYTK